MRTFLIRVLGTAALVADIVLAALRPEPPRVVLDESDDDTERAMRDGELLQHAFAARVR